MKLYIKSSTNSFATSEDMCNAVRKLFSGYIAKEEYVPNVKQYWFWLERVFGNFEIIVGLKDRSSRVPGALYTSSNADSWPCYLKISDNPDTKSVLDAFRQLGFQEACNYSNSQWGTYKVLINSYEELSTVANILDRWFLGLEDDTINSSTDIFARTLCVRNGDTINRYKFARQDGQGEEYVGNNWWESYIVTPQDELLVWTMRGSYIPSAREFWIDETDGTQPIPASTI